MQSASPLPFLLAVCREDLGDERDWTLYFLNDLPSAVEVVIERVSYEWGDMGHTEATGERVHVASEGAARLWRVDDSAAEISASVVLRVLAPQGERRVTFELGKLYRYREPTYIEKLGRPGWVRTGE
jgi:hypothetical protein